jgi:hypothetical protein
MDERGSEMRAGQVTVTTKNCCFYMQGRMVRFDNQDI